MGKYDDIIDLPHHVSEKRPHMSVADRAAQFAPFAALTGYGDAIDEAARPTDKKVEQGESSLEELDEKLASLAARISERPRISVTCFRPDDRKEGGAYVMFSGALKKIEQTTRRLVFEDGTSVCADDISAISEED